MESLTINLPETSQPPWLSPVSGSPWFCQSVAAESYSVFTWRISFTLITVPRDVSNVQSAALLHKINNTGALIIVGTPLAAAAAGLSPVTPACARLCSSNKGQI